MGLVALLLAAPASGQSVTIERTGAVYGSIAGAITDAAAGDVLRLDGFTFAEQVRVSKDLTIRGAGPQTVITFDDPAEDAAVEVNTGRTLTLEDLTVVSSLNGGVVHRGGSAGGLTVRRVTFATAAPFDGGGIASNARPVVVEDCVFAATTAGASGGAIDVFGGSLVVTGSTFDHPSAGNGGAIHAASATLVRLEDNRFDGPVATVAGGAVSVESVDLVELRRNWVCEASAANGGALAGVLDATDELVVENNVLIGATGSFGGGALEISNGTTTLTNNTLLATVGPLGDGAINLTGGAADLRNNVFAGVSGPVVVAVATTPTVAYDDFHDTVDGIGVALGVGNLVDVDPALVAFSDDGDCGNDAPWPRAGSPLLDAGDPSILDPDGGPSDIGAYGGPGADPTFHGDADGDGARFLVDCDDLDADVFPGATDGCDGKDNDCSGAADDDPSAFVAWYPDADGDGFGDDQASPTLACAAPVGAVDDGTDCDDGDGGAFPGNPEVACDGADDDCDPGTPDAGDLDGDGVDRCGGDCDDADPAVSPQEVEASCNGRDDDCDPATLDDADADGDGVRICALDCDDADPARFPGAVEVCNGVDDDCTFVADDDDAFWVDTWPDADRDGFGEAGGAPLFGCPSPDGAPTDTDCDDADGDIHPGHPDQCDGKNNDCVGAPDDDPAEYRDWWPDLDADGHGDALATPVRACELPPGFSPDATDCDDADAARFADNPDRCDGLDNDCTGVADDDPRYQGSWWPDVDGDTYGDGTLAPVVACEAPAGFLADDLDCDDANAAIHPLAAERCDGAVDGNCDGDPDFAAIDQIEVYPDLDGDGFGDPGGARDACDPRVGFEVAVGGDCDDGDALVNPSVEDRCDGRDDDCSGDEANAVDADPYWPDRDGDGAGDLAASPEPSCGPVPGSAPVGGDCDDADDTRFPGAEEACNQLDDDCDLDVDEGPAARERDWWPDLDGDGFGRADAEPVRQLCAPGDDWIDLGEDCDDGSADARPGGTEVCDDLDNDCDGGADLDDPDWSPPVRWADEDGDGHGAGDPFATCDFAGTAEDGLDCHDGAPDISPDAEEVPGNTVDEDCDGDVPMDAPKAPDAGCNCAHGPAGPAWPAAPLAPALLLLARRRRR